MQRFVQLWGNESWSASAAFLLAILDWLPQTSGPIVECGSGVSTVLLAIAASTYGRRVYSLEHDPEWAERMVHKLPAAVRGSVEVCLAPLESYGDFDWYSLEGVTLPTGIGFVVCDGPPGSTRGGRYGLGAVMRSYFAPHCVVLLDDTQRDSERAILNRWCSELHGGVVDGTDSYSILRVGDLSSAGPAPAAAPAR